MTPPGLLIAAPASGTGKTTLMLGLLAAFRAQGLAVQPFKSGPDYIDPAFHAAAAGRASLNLDSWAMQPAHLASLMQAAEGADLVLAEGSMGLFDGVATVGETGNRRQRGYRRPRRLARGAGARRLRPGAIGRGDGARLCHAAQECCARRRRAQSRREPASRGAGARRHGDRRHPRARALPKQQSVALPERHLGLVQAEEQPRLAQILAEMAGFVATHVDLTALRAIAARTKTADIIARPDISPPGNRIALARDAAFSFIYPHLLAGWRAAGAEILPFSPLADEAPDMSADACWLPGGYPELHAGRLAAATRFHSGLRSFAETKPIHGECGGYMAMGEGLIDASGTRHQMTGFFKLTTSFEKRRMHLGYRLATLTSPIPGHAAGTRLRGHEFHYASILEHNDAPLAQVVDASGAVVPETGSSKIFDGGGRATGSFFHLIAEAT